MRYDLDLTAPLSLALPRRMMQPTLDTNTTANAQILGANLGLTLPRHDIKEISISATRATDRTPE